MPRKHVALCLFRHAVEKAIRTAGLNRLNAYAGRSEDELRKYLRKLARLDESDPDRTFWVLLEKANLKLLKYISHKIQ